MKFIVQRKVGEERSYKDELNDIFEEDIIVIPDSEAILQIADFIVDDNIPTFAKAEEYQTMRELVYNILYEYNLIDKFKTEYSDKLQDWAQEYYEYEVKYE